MKKALQSKHKGIFLCAFFSLVFVLLFQTQIYAKENENDTAGKPVTILADYIHYDNQTGDIFAQGYVRIIQDDQIITGDRFDGNVKNQDVWTKQLVNFQQNATQTNVYGNSAEYNYKTKTGQVNTVYGKTGKQYITAEKVDILPDKLVADEATMSRCGAQTHVKCYHITAKKIDIWVNDKIIAYDVNVYILGKKMLYRDRYVVALTGENSNVPRIGWDSDDGLYIKYSYIYPLNKDFYIGANFTAATEVGGRTLGWFLYEGKNFNAKYSYGYEQDDDSNWIRKENNIKINYHTKPIFKTALNYRLWFERGFWVGNNKESWHTEAGIYINHNPIYFDGKKTLHMTLGTGYRKLKESYGNIDQDEFRYDVGLHKKISHKWSIGTNYSNVKNNVSLFEYNKVDVPESWIYYATWSPDDLNAVSLLQEYDTKNNRVYRNKIEYKRNLHCWDLTLYYERKNPINSKTENKVHWEISWAI